MHFLLLLGTWSAKTHRHPFPRYDTGEKISRGAQSIDIHSSCRSRMDQTNVTDLILLLRVRKRAEISSGWKKYPLW